MDTHILAPAAQVIGIFFTLLYFSRQAAEERRAMEGRMSRVDDRFAKVDERFAKLDERWLKAEEQILKIMNKLDMNR